MESVQTHASSGARALATLMPLWARRSRRCSGHAFRGTPFEAETNRNARALQDLRVRIRVLYRLQQVAAVAPVRTGG